MKEKMSIINAHNKRQCYIKKNHFKFIHSEYYFSALIQKRLIYIQSFVIFCFLSHLFFVTFFRQI